MSQTMRYLSDGRIEVIGQDVPDPSANEVQVTGGACGICSWDLVTAKLGDQMSPMAPPGHEGVGYVSKIGAEVTGVKEGDRVAGGGFATVRNLSAERLYKIPESEKPDQYWIVEPVSCGGHGSRSLPDPRWGSGCCRRLRVYGLADYAGFAAPST